MVRVAQMASMYRSQLAEVDGQLLKARKLVVKLNPNKKSKRKLSPLPKKALNEKKKSFLKSKKASIITKDKRAVTRSKTPNKPRKSSLISSPISRNPPQNQITRLKQEYAEKVADYLQQVYQPYEAKLAALKEISEFLEREHGCLLDFMSKGYPIAQDLALLITDYEKQNSILKGQLTNLVQNTGEAEAVNEINHLRLSLVEKEEFLNQQLESKDARSVMIKEQSELRDLAMELQSSESQRAHMYAIIEKLNYQINAEKQSANNRNTSKDPQQKEAQIISEKLREENTKLALQGRTTEQRLNTLHELEENLQRYHDNFQSCSNDPAYTTEALYADYLSFLTETYEDFLEKLVQQEEEYLSYCALDHEQVEIDHNEHEQNFD